MKEIQNVCIFGAGAMGSVYASLFYEMSPDSVTILAGGHRRDRLREKGIRVNGRRYPVKVISPDDTAPASDLILIGLKHNHLAGALGDLKHRVGAHTTLLSVMNGIDSEETIGEVYGMDKMLYAAAVGIDALRQNGEVSCTDQGRLFFGEPHNDPVSERVAAVQAFFDRAGIVYETPVDMIRILWWKFMINVGVNQASAVLRAPFGVFQQRPEAVRLMESAMAEVIAVAAAKGIDLHEQDIDQWKGVLAKLPPEGKTSMLQDLEAGRKTEVDMFAGRMLELGRRLNIATPVNRVLYSIIRVMEADPAAPPK